MIRIVYPLAVGPNNANIEILCYFNYLLLEFFAFVIRLGKTAGNNNCTFDALFSTLLHGLGHESSRDDNDGQIHSLFNLLDALVTGQIENNVGLGIDRINVALEAAVYNVFQNFLHKKKRTATERQSKLRRLR